MGMVRLYSVAFVVLHGKVLLSQFDLSRKKAQHCEQLGEIAV